MSQTLLYLPDFAAMAKCHETGYEQTLLINLIQYAFAVAWL